MTRERTLKILLVLLGGVSVLAVIPLVLSLLGADRIPTAEEMILAIYAPIGVYLLAAIRNPSANRPLILCAGWLNVSHATVMVVEVLQHRGEPGQLYLSMALAIVSLALVVLAPRRQASRSPAVAAAAEPAPAFAAGETL